MHVFAVNSPFETLARSAAAAFVAGWRGSEFRGRLGRPDDYLEPETFEPSDEAILSPKRMQ